VVSLVRCGEQTATATVVAVAYLARAAAGLKELASPAGLFTALLATALMMATALLTGVGLGLIGLSGAVAHVVMILNHVLATFAIFLVSILCHWTLLSPRPWFALAIEMLGRPSPPSVRRVAKGVE